MDMSPYTDPLIGNILLYLGAGDVGERVEERTGGNAEFTGLAVGGG